MSDETPQPAQPVQPVPQEQPAQPVEPTPSTDQPVQPTPDQVGPEGNVPEPAEQQEEPKTDPEGNVEDLDAQDNYRVHGAVAQQKEYDDREAARTAERLAHDQRTRPESSDGTPS